ncbi:hypothetical protein ACLXBB_14285, partial [Pseudomonas aeruginosa]
MCPRASQSAGERPHDLNATGYSLAGFLAAFRGEAAFRQLVLLNVVLIP